MKGLELEYNGEKWVAAIEDVVVTGITTIRSSEEGTEIDLHLGGLESGDKTKEHVIWLDKALQVGDTITIKVVDVEDASPAKSCRKHKACRIS